MSDPEFELTDELASFIGDLHDSEINGEISWFFDDVWGVKIGDRLNGYQAEATFAAFPQAMGWLRDKVRGWVWLWRHRSHLRQRRAQLRAEQTVPDRQWMTVLTDRLDTPLVDPPGVARPLRSVASS